jgi:hypothetical protein
MVSELHGAFASIASTLEYAWIVSWGGLLVFLMVRARFR